MIFRQPASTCSACAFSLEYVGSGPLTSTVREPGKTPLHTCAHQQGLDTGLTYSMTFRTCWRYAGRTCRHGVRRWCSTTSSCCPLRCARATSTAPHSAWRAPCSTCSCSRRPRAPQRSRPIATRASSASAASSARRCRLLGVVNLQAFSFHSSETHTPCFLDGWYHMVNRSLVKQASFLLASLFLEQFMSNLQTHATHLGRSWLEGHAFHSMMQLQ